MLDVFLCLVADAEFVDEADDEDAVDDVELVVIFKDVADVGKAKVKAVDVGGSSSFSGEEQESEPDE